MFHGLSPGFVGFTPISPCNFCPLYIPEMIMFITIKKSISTNNNHLNSSQIDDTFLIWVNVPYADLLI